MAAKRSEFVRVKVFAEFEIPRRDYQRFKMSVTKSVNALCDGDDWNADYLALDMVERSATEKIIT